MRKISLAFTILTILFILSSSSVSAAVYRNGNRIDIPKGQDVKESLYISGKSINIDANVDGDIFCAAQTVRITGRVNGDVICGAQSIVVTGEINGNLRAGAQSIDLEGIINRNANLFGQNIEISSGSAIMGEANIWSQDVDVRGVVTKKLDGGAQIMTILGKVGEVDVHVEELSVGPEAVVQNNLTYTSLNKAKLSANSLVGGQILQRQPPASPEKTQSQNRRPTRSVLGIGRIISLIVQLILATLIVAFFAKPMNSASAVMYKKILPTLGIGLLILIFTPVIMVIIALTLIGIPLSILLLFVYIFSFFIGRVLAAGVVGRLLLEKFWVDKKENDMWSVIIGIIAMWFIFSIPIVGSILSVIVLIWGLGGVYYLFRPIQLKTSEKQ